MTANDILSQVKKEKRTVLTEIETYHLMSEQYQATTFLRFEGEPYDRK